MKRTKREMVNVKKTELRAMIAALGLRNAEVASLLGVGEFTLRGWMARERMPQSGFSKLESAVRSKGTVLVQTDVSSGEVRIAIPGINKELSLAKASTLDLLKELSKRLGHKVIIEALDK